MFPIALASIIGVAVIVERFLSLRISKIAPRKLRNLYTTGEDFGTSKFKGCGEFSYTTLGIIYAAINQYADLNEGELKLKVDFLLGVCSQTIVIR